MKQYSIRLRNYSRGFHIITEDILEQLEEIPETGVLHLFLQHTSAGLCLNENADPTVLKDLNNWFDKNIEENEPYYEHTFEGADDMPAHIKSILTGCQISIPISNGKLNLGTWQGIYLAEFRNHGGERKIIASIYH